MSSGFAPTDATAARTTLGPLPDAGLDLDLDLGFGDATPSPAPAAVASHVASFVASQDDAPSFDMPSSLMSPKTTPTAAPASGAMEFDMSGINLDLGGSDGEMPDDPYETKFALAEECQRLGDKDSARSILREIVDMATGAIRSKAEKMLGDIR
jgi:pilus assembly protein FimV